MSPDQGFGITIAFATSAFVAQIVGFRRSGMKRGDIDTSHSETPPDAAGEAAAKTFKPSDMYDPGMLVLDIHFDINNPPPITKAAEQITVQFPIKDTETVGGKYVFSGYINENDEDYAPIDDRTMRATISVKAAGKYTYTPATTP